MRKYFKYFETLKFIKTKEILKKNIIINFFIYEDINKDTEFLILMLFFYHAKNSPLFEIIFQLFLLHLYSIYNYI